MEREPRKEEVKKIIIELHQINAENGKDVYAVVDKNGEASATGEEGDYAKFESTEAAEKEAEKWRKEGWETIVKEPKY
jgi:hypothetical protein